jgi:hypothetical protein
MDPEVGNTTIEACKETEFERSNRLKIVLAIYLLRPVLVCIAGELVVAALHRHMS